MFKISIDDFIFEVKEELSCYEDLGSDGAEKWVQGFNKWLSEKKKPVKEISLKDESDIFEIADEFMEAVEEGTVGNYWKHFSI